MSPQSYMVETPVLRPTKEEFSRPFCEYVEKVFRKQPDLPMFKVVPPPGWTPRRCARVCGLRGAMHAHERAGALGSRHTAQQQSRPPAGG
jgi:hypothetical protein